MSDSSSPTRKARNERANVRSRSRSRENPVVQNQEPKSPDKEADPEENKENPSNTPEIVFQLPEAFQSELPNDIIMTDGKATISDVPYEISLKISKERPNINVNYGDNRLLIDEKNKITQYRIIWEDKIKHLISDYELIDICRPKGKAKYNRSIIKFMDYNKVKRNYLSSQKELSEVFSRAYYKLNEVLHISQILNEYKGKGLKIACLAEGPGGFINCLVDYRNIQNHEEIQANMKKYKLPYCYWTDDEYYAITLKVKKQSQYNRALDWDHYKSKQYFNILRANKYRVLLSYATGDGDMLNTQNLYHFLEKDLKRKKCELVTADGGMELSTDEEFEYQELYNVKLFFSEAITAMACQKVGGKFIMKIYDSFFDITIDILILLTVYYERVRITKPLTSRPASSERYVVCENFKGISEERLKELFTLLEKWVEIEKNMDYLKNESFVVKFLDFEENPKALFKRNLRESNEECIDSQIKKIKEGISILEEKKENEIELEKKKGQKEKAIAWCKLYNIPYLENLELE